MANSYNTTGRRLIDEFYCQPDDHVKPRKVRKDKKVATPPAREVVQTPLRKSADISNYFGDGDCESAE